MAENMDRSYLTGFQPMLAKPPVDYMTRYSTFNYGPGAYESLQRADAALQIRQNAEARRRADIDYHDMMEGDDIASYLGGGGYEMDKGRLELYLREGSYDKARELADAMRARRDDNERSVFAWTKVRGSGEEFADAIATNALELWGGKYLDSVKVNDGKGGAVSARVLLDGTSPEARDRMAQTLAKNLGVSTEAGRVLSDYTNPYYAVFSQLRNAAASGAALRENPRTAGEGRLITDQVRAAEPLYADFIVRQAAKLTDNDSGARDSLKGFVGGMIQNFGGSLGKGDLDSLYGLFLADQQRAGGNLGGEAWVADMKGAIDGMVPKHVVPKSTGRSDRQGLPVYTPVYEPVGNADHRRFVSLIGQTSEVLSQQGTQFSTRAIAGALGKLLQQEYDIKTVLGVEDFAELDLSGEALPQAAAASLMGESYQPPSADAGKERRLGEMVNTVRHVSNSLGYNQDGSTSDPSGLSDLTSEIRRTIARNLLSANPGDLNDDVASTVADWFDRSQVRLPKEDVDRIAARIVGNFNTGRAENLSTILLDGDGDSYLVHNKDGSYAVDSSTGAIATQSPDAKLDLIEGKMTKARPAEKPDSLGNLTTDAEVLRKSSTYRQTAFELRKIAETGTGPSAAAAQALLDIQAAAIKGSGEKVTLGDNVKYSGAFGELILENLGKSKVQLPPKTMEFLKSGRGLTYLQEADKSVTDLVFSFRPSLVPVPIPDTTNYDKDRLAEVGEVMDELAEHVQRAASSLDGVTETTLVEADLLSRLVAETTDRLHVMPLASYSGPSTPLTELIGSLNLGKGRLKGVLPGDLNKMAARVLPDWAVKGFTDAVQKEVKRFPKVAAGLAEVAEFIPANALVVTTDKDAASFLSELQSGLQHVLGKDPSKAFKDASGFGFSEDVGSRDRDSADNFAYGGILAKYQALNWVLPVQEQVKVTEEQQRNRPQGTPDAPGYNDRLLAALAAVTPRDEQEALISSRLDEVLLAATQDSEVAKEMAPPIRADLQKALRVGGMTAARRYLGDLSSKTLVYIPVEATRQSLANPGVTEPYLRYTPAWYTADQLRAYKDAYKLTDGMLPADQQANRVRYRAQVDEERRRQALLDSIDMAAGKGL